MDNTIVSSNVVIVAQQFNPSILNHSFLIEEGIIDKREDIHQDSLVSMVCVQINSKKFQMLVVPEQLQFTLTPSVQESEQQAVIIEKLGKLMNALPHIPYKGIGLNFIWHISPETKSMSALTKELFFRKGSPLFKEFDTDEAYLGSYMSKNIQGFRLGLDIRPLEDPQNKKTSLQFVFNFHKNTEGNPSKITEMQLALSKWNEVRQEAQHIVDLTIGSL